ncbi:WD40/YVTN/BNR-like repeat-containing protein [Duganella hordei]|uniref:WD40/YVTN/BNR-like repeat-containing protein n=1 Tax=Duganella hordei TaxID=2865934 RepID=UPI0030E9B314
MFFTKNRIAGAAIAAWLALGVADAGFAADAALRPEPAVRAAHAATATTLDAAWAGTRVVAVGDHGVVELSDDQGLSFRQARSVPVSTMLNSVSFADARSGWAVGHWGVILHSRDGGESWELQRLAADEDRPLFAVHFFNAREGVAVGLWSLVLVTEDGGKTWQKQTLTPPPGSAKADLNLFGLFAGPAGILYAAAEHGMVLRSADRGRTWTYLGTGYRGSFWSGIGLADGTLVVAGLRGSMYRSTDQGAHWSPVTTGLKSSITRLVEAKGKLLAVGLDGLHIVSDNGGLSFSNTSTAGGASLTAALIAADGRQILFSTTGPVPPAAPQRN